MKKEYLKPEMMISLFDTKDVITGSPERLSILDDPVKVGEGDSLSNNVSIPYPNN